MTSAPDVRAMLRLVAQVADLPHHLQLRCTYLLHGLCRWLGAEVGVWKWLPIYQPDALPCSPIVVGWSSGNQRSDLIESARKDQLTVERRILPLIDGAASGTAISRRCVDLRLDNGQSETHRELRCLCAVYRVQEHACLSCVSLHRPDGSQAFSRSQRESLALFWSELEWLHAAAANPDLEPSFSPRLQQTLECLLAGGSVKEIAARLRLSTHTVTGYIKQIHRQLGVSSRGELLAKWIKPLEAQLPVGHVWYSHDD